MKHRLQSGVGTGKKDRVLRQPFQRGVLFYKEVLIQTCLRTAATIELAGTGHGDKRVAVWIKLNGNVEFIATHNATRRMQKIKVTGLFFGIKRALNGEGTDVSRRVQNRLFRGVTKLQRERSLPAVGVLFCWCALQDFAPVYAFPNGSSMDQPLAFFVIGKDDDTTKEAPDILMRTGLRACLFRCFFLF